ncbi:hypothetical protein M2346_000226 [Sphingobium xanthum]|nr:hypothetical protein [Sphingobium sp. B10D3B]MCW2400207.1 hypothetical protein [Sphingobium sp. B10D7B]MCW2407185.1 hypothetical protein [Sphingobium xanthum]
MNWPQLIGIGCAVTSSCVGAFGLFTLKPLPPSARLGALATLDSDGNGQLSRAEWASGGRKAGAFDAQDTNRNGILEPAEVRSRRGAARKD